MCYSAKIQANYREYVRLYGADMDVETFSRLYFARAAGGDIKIPRAVDAAFLDSSGIADIAGAINEFRTRRTRELEADLFGLRARLAAAERKLAQKVTKTATDKIDSALRGRWRGKCGT
ncbi:hypothetical protein DP57_5920 [Burkholderia pseudomallei]|nr:hypothetical protein [Burkholderia pseudomallei]KGC70113.1 hypothetical protein DP57_5920 [Burkholderia pseudomallei]